MNQSSIYSRLLVAVGAAIAAIALLAPVASAAEPAEGYKQFAGCPSPKTENSKITTCFRVNIKAGHFQMGSKDVPIEKPIELSGGFNINASEFAYTSKGGLTPVQQKIPGGLVGLTGLDWLLDFFSVEALNVYATTELAGSPSHPLVEPLKLPIKVHLTNPSGLLGSSCYVGSTGSPISLSLITGTTAPPPPNEPITGVKGKPTLGGAKGITKLSSTYVDNSFAAPAASGCKLVIGFIPINIDSIVNLQSGLPSAAGTNETIQETDAEIVASKFVYP
jgi:hypothetical protein